MIGIVFSSSVVVVVGFFALFCFVLRILNEAMNPRSRDTASSLGGMAWSNQCHVI